MKIGRFGCTAGDHTVPHAEHISLLRAAQHAVRFWKDDGSDLCFVSDCQLVVTAGSVEGSFVAGLNTGSPTSGDKSLQHWTGSSVLVGVCRRWRLTQSRAEVDTGRLSHHGWSGK